MKQDYQVGNPWAVPQLTCRKTNPISRVCLNPHCTLALVCDLPTCTTCGREVHKFCYSTSLDQFTTLVNQPLVSFGKFMEGLCEIEEVLVEKIRESRA